MLFIILTNMASAIINLGLSLFLWRMSRHARALNAELGRRLAEMPMGDWPPKVEP